MKINILFIGLVLLLLGWSVQSASTVLTYIVQRELDQQDHYVQLTLKIQSDGRSLKQSIRNAQVVIKNIKQIVIQDCEKNAADKEAKKQCKQIVEDSKFQVEPKYHMVRKIPTFTLFILTHQVTIKIKNVKGLGRLTDQIVAMGEGYVTLQEFVWKTDEEVDAEITTLKDGLQEGRQLCQKIGQTLQEVISVEELQAPEEEQEQDDQRDQDLAEQDIQLTIFKFKVKCGPVTKGKKAK